MRWALEISLFPTVGNSPAKASSGVGLEMLASSEAGIWTTSKTRQSHRFRLADLEALAISRHLLSLHSETTVLLVS